MADQYYDSDLTGKQLDAAFAKMANIDTYANQAASSASEASGYAETATSAASQAQTYASQANTAKNNAQTYAGQASDSADSAQTYAGQASGSASAAAASAASIEGDVAAAANSASAAAQSATQASGSASAAAQSASAAANSEDSVQQNAAAAQQAAAAASQSKSDAEAAASNAASSASTAQQAASLIEENLSAIQAAPSNAQAAQQAAAQAAASASAAEDAAERAEQIADFNPADFATAAQGEKADTAVQPADLDDYALKTDVPDTPADIGAATAAQGAKADTAVQSVNGAKPDSSGNVQLDLTTGTVRSVNGKDPDGSGNVHLSAGDVGAATAAQGQKADSAVQTVNGQEPDTRGNVQITIPTAGVTSVNGKTGAVTLSAADVDAAQELLTGDITNVTPAQVREALQAGRQVILTVNSGNDILAAWVDTGTNVQCLFGWNVGTYANRPRAVSTDAYFGNPTGSNTWSYEKLYGNVLPEVTSADNGKTVVVQNGQWNLGTAGGGGEFTLIANTGLTSWSENNSYNSFALYTGNYDAVGIEFYPNYVTDTDVFSPMQVFPIPENGQSRKYGVVCMDVNSSPMGEAQTRIIEIQNNGLSGVKITSVTGGYYYNWGSRGADDRCAVPARIYGIKY